jgi:hypothetical protein
MGALLRCTGESIPQAQIHLARKMFRKKAREV